MKSVSFLMFWGSFEVGSFLESMSVKSVSFRCYVQAVKNIKNFMCDFVCKLFK